MKLTNKAIARLLSGLNSLNGRTRVIETEGKPANAVFESFAFPAQARVNIIRNTGILRPLAEEYDEAINALVKHLTPTGGTNKDIDNDPLLLNQFIEEREGLLNATMDVKGLLLLNWTDLDAAKVSAEVVCALGILVRGLPKPDDADLVPEF